jgi:regulator of replication initiation timing
METNNNNQKIKTLRRFIIILLLLFITSLIIMVLSMRQKSETYTQNIQMKDELALLMNEYEAVRQENIAFQSQLTERDSIILANSQEIQKLINSQADYRRIRRQLDLLRNITQDYVRRIDSLIIVNEELALENEEIRKDLSVERAKYRELSQVKTQLDDKVTLASSLKAYNLRAHALRVRGSNETETDRAVRADKISINFTLSENKIVPSGPRTIYVRIARPDDVIILAGEGDEYAFELNENLLQFTIKQDIVYDNKAQNISMSWTKRDTRSPAMAGVYTVTIFMDNQEIGQTFFELK